MVCHTVSGDIVYDVNDTQAYSYLEATLGYKLVDAGNFQLGLFVGYGMSSFYDDYFVGNVALAGADITFAIDDAISINASLETTLWGAGNTGFTTYSLTSFDIGLQYLFTESFGLSVGYTYTYNTGTGGFNDFGVEGFKLNLVYSF